MDWLNVKRGIVHVAGIFVLGAVLGGGFVYLAVQPGETLTVEDITRLKETGKGSVDDATLYRSDKYGFTLQYPKELIIKEFDEGEGAMTIVFQSPHDILVGFQVYVAPYTESTITGERIIFDASGAIKDLKEENLREDLLVATFKSEAPLLGATTEIWFLHGGYLFEVTSVLSLDSWLRDIVKKIDFSE